MLHSSKNPAPITAKDVNHEKGLWTRSKMKVLFDDEKKGDTIETPAGNKIELSEDDKSIKLTDQNKNSITDGDRGHFTGQPKRHQHYSQRQNQHQGYQDLNMQGLKVAGKAQTQMSLQGSAGAKLMSSAIVQIPGSLVKIN